MADNVKQGFEELEANLAISGLPVRAVSERQQEIADLLARELAIRDVVLTGSYKRGTMIAPLKEAAVESCVVLDSSDIFPDWNCPANILDRVEGVLKQQFIRSTDVSRSAQAVRIVFPDFRVDIVPAFLFAGRGFLIPDSSARGWISSDPDKQVETWRNANMVQRGKLIPLIKMIKAWNAVHGKKLRSYHLETLVLKVFTNCPIGEYGLAVKEFFEKSPQHLDYLPDPSGASGNVGYYLDFVAMHQALDILKEAHNRALRANYLDDFGKTDQAFGEWRAIFGDYFPHYAERRVYGNPALVV